MSCFRASVQLTSSWIIQPPPPSPVWQCCVIVSWWLWGFFFLNVSSVLKSLNDFSSRRETSNSCFLIQQKLCFSSGQSWPLIYKMAPKKTERRWWVITRAAGWLVHSSFSWLSGNSSASILIWLNPFESIFEEEMPNLFWFQLLKKMNVF